MAMNINTPVMIETITVKLDIAVIRKSKDYH